MAERVPEKQRVVQVGISMTSYAQVVALCRSWAAERRSHAEAAAHYICVTSVHGVIMAQDDPEIARILNDADIATPDGMPLVWALRSFGARQQQRVYGPTLMLELCRDAVAHRHRIFLYGGREDTLPLLRSRLEERFPGLEIAGSYSPPFRALTAEEDAMVQQLIRAADPDIVFVGISTPKQEKWMYDHRHAFPGVTMIGVGAAFDFHAGRTRQAPAWIQRNGLEWLFRLLVEPARLWRRYLLITPRFLPLWAWQKLRSLAKGRGFERVS
ncbi:MAG TPA: WecB/TagA/CpsF family glycosyltransferase [Bryobacteraceae bacterium]|jgi:N-acetylglucosaminyldiphosphoundecaprenol N-acetyl-beta-D-mannosaminyltransferase|nr:WecB/TagA/CpsF family glycosyltransferase [Bryobacteraceae bacterium]